MRFLCKVSSYKISQVFQIRLLCSIALNHPITPFGCRRSRDARPTVFGRDKRGLSRYV